MWTEVAQPNSRAGFWEEESLSPRDLRSKQKEVGSKVAPGEACGGHPPREHQMMREWEDTQGGEL